MFTWLLIKVQFDAILTVYRCLTALRKSSDALNRFNTEKSSWNQECWLRCPIWWRQTVWVFMTGRRETGFHQEGVDRVPAWCCKSMNTSDKVKRMLQNCNLNSEIFSPLSAFSFVCAKSVIANQMHGVLQWFLVSNAPDLFISTAFNKLTQVCDSRRTVKCTRRSGIGNTGRNESP